MAKKPIHELLRGETRFERLAFIREIEPRKRPNTKYDVRRALFSCDCGRRHEASVSAVVSGQIRSCGCLQLERVTASIRQRATTHGMSKSAPEYYVWGSLKQRCLNPNVRNWADYGGRGIKVCDRWRDSFEAFYADMGPRPSPSHSIDRIDNDGDYTPQNCQWSALQFQAVNRRCNIVVECQGRQMALSEAARISGVKYSTARMRLKKGWSVEAALTP